MVSTTTLLALASTLLATAHSSSVDKLRARGGGYPASNPPGVTCYNTWETVTNDVSFALSPVSQPQLTPISARRPILVRRRRQRRQRHQSRPRVEPPEPQRVRADREQIPRGIQHQRRLTHLPHKRGMHSCPRQPCAEIGVGPGGQHRVRLHG